MGKIWFHIGSPKTGTTSLQGFLNDNAAKLRGEGRMNFVEAARSHIAHNQLASAARMGEAERLFDQIGREADEMPDATHVVSSELLFNSFTARKVAAAVPENLKNRSKVICYIRRQDSYLEALYKQLLKNSRIEPDRQAFLADARRRVRYLDTLNAYADAFGRKNVIVRPFGPKTLISGDIVHDFASQIGLELTPGLKLHQGFANRTFSAEMSEMLSLMGEKTDFNVREVIRELIALNHPGTIRSRDVFSRAERRQLMDVMARENKKLVRRYLPDHGDFFDASDLDAKDDGPPERGLEDQISDRIAATEAIMMAMGNLQRRRKQELELTADETPPPDTHNGLEEEFAPPSWYREIYPGGDHTGWFQKFGDYSCSFVDRGTDQLVVSFDNLSQAGNDAYAREPWAQKFCEDRGYAHLGIYAQKPTWFRNADLIDHLEKLRDEGFFRRFKNVSFVGTSMGAFGALSFSSLAPGATVVAFSPQTTLDSLEVPWEERFAKGRAADWTLPYSDAALETGSASKIYLIYDHFHIGDRRHIERLSGDNLIKLKGFGIGHKSALVLSRMDALKQVMEDGVKGTLDPQDFYKALRARKDIYLYRQSMEGYLKDRGQETRATRFGTAFKKRRRLIARADES
jgi:hypothetical protein